MSPSPNCTSLKLGMPSDSVGEVDSEYDIGGIPIPPAHVIEKQKKKFSLADA